jgi:hypothetical protein
MQWRRFVEWSFNHYLAIAPPPRRDRPASAPLVVPEPAPGVG